MYPTFKVVREEFVQALLSLYDKREAENLCFECVAFITGWERSTWLANLHTQVDPHLYADLAGFLEQLRLGRPLQYITGRAWFINRWFEVNESVLIPRPETEELVHWILSDFTFDTIKVLDIGTGSGIIPISLKSKRNLWEIHGCDVSLNALNVAQGNDENLLIHWYLEDILQPIKQFDPKLDLIVSNPPYVLERDKDQMIKQVLDYEPHIALFVPNEDPLLFYKAIIDLAEFNLKTGGHIYFEMHETLGEQLNALMIQHGFTAVEIRKDLQHKERMIKAVKA
jgi:release factor glutamine methyltransferase